jgi:hypothetical protein
VLQRRWARSDKDIFGSPGRRVADTIALAQMIHVLFCEALQRKVVNKWSTEVDMNDNLIISPRQLVIITRVAGVLCWRSIIGVVHTEVGASKMCA